MLPRYAIPAVALLLLPLAAGAQSFRCVGADGKKYYGSSVPPQCAGQVVEQLNAQGNVVKRSDPKAEASERAKKEAEEAERKKQAAIAKEQGRRDQALLATYGSELDIEEGRKRALEQNQRMVKELESRVAALREKPSAQTEAELKTQETLLAEKKKETAAINAKYDDDRKRFLELTRK